jgi:hypothetical protein
VVAKKADFPADRFLMDLECTLLENGKVVRSGRGKEDVKRELVQIP